MPQPYSADLRECVQVDCERGDLPQVEIARRFQVCLATISNWRRPLSQSLLQFIEQTVLDER